MDHAPFLPLDRHSTTAHYVPIGETSMKHHHIKALVVAALALIATPLRADVTLVQAASIITDASKPALGPSTVAGGQAKQLCGCEARREDQYR
jgi:hypothetical protein